MKFIDEIDVKGKTVFVRADLNVPLTEGGSGLTVADDTRLVAALETVNYIFKEGGKVILASHLGRPKGKKDPKLSLKPVAKRIEELTKRKCIMAPDCVGDQVKALADELQFGEILLLENLRFHAEEEKNDIGFAGKLAGLGTVFVNDAFATAHRAHASNVGITAFFPEIAGGLTVKRELEYFTQAFQNPATPLVVIFGGAKVSTKIGAIENVSCFADKILIGGAMANTFFAAEGLEVGNSLYEPEEIENALALKEVCIEEDCQLLLPIDVVVAKELTSGVETKVVNIQNIPSGWMALDIGPKSVSMFVSAIEDAKTIVWNGPMGAFEVPEFSNGTNQVIDALAKSEALTVVGGGDTDHALIARNAFDKMSYVSTAGGAFIALLEGQALPGIEALDPASHEEAPENENI